jgi:SAM-dependent methyltransferase/lauroyl/myristoyl acyltransferase
MRPGFHRLARGAKKLAVGVTRRNPALGLRIAGLLGHLAALNPRTRRAPTAEDVRELFGELDPRPVQRIRRRIASLEFRNEMMTEVVMRHGLEPLVGLVTAVRAEPLLRLRAAGVPVITIGWHLGPFRALPLALRKLAIRSLVGIWEVHGESDREGDVVRCANLAEGANSNAFLKRAHRVLKDGCVVCLQLDWFREDIETVSFLRRRVGVGRGAASLARLTGARLLPVTSRFVGTSGRIEVVLHEPIPDADLDRAQGDAFDHALLTRAAKWFEARAVEEPGQLRPERLRWTLASPSTESSDCSGQSFDTGLTARDMRRRDRLLERGRREKRDEWETLWGASDFEARWQLGEICAELREAVETGWFPPRGRALDAGCGEGDTAAWLAQQGYVALGVDIAAAAVSRARRTHGELAGRLRFEQLDLCVQAPETAPDAAPFQLVVDRGCFHQLREEEHRGYGRHLAAVCDPDARLLLFARAFQDGAPFGDRAEREAKRLQLMYAFGPYFRLERMTLTYLDRYRGERPEYRAPGIVFWLRRRGITT